MTSQLATDQSYESETQDARVALSDTGTIRRHILAKGTVLFRRGEQRQCAYLIDRGEVHIIGNDEGGADRLLCVIGAGEIFGEMALIDGSARTATAVTASETELFVIPRDALHERFRSLDPVVSLLIGLLIERYRFTRINLPETIKQDRHGDLLTRLGRLDPRPGDAARLKELMEKREEALREMKIEQELRSALERKQFVPALQPIFRLDQTDLAGFEMLIRWHHPERGFITPGEFIPVAERTGLIGAIDLLMLEEACNFLPLLHRKRNDLFVSVNLSGVNFSSIDIVGKVADIFGRTGANPAHIQLEITESALIGDPDVAQQVVRGLKDLGVSMALDDFGTGYSSLGYLHKLPIDTLKIDRSFISHLHDNERGLDIVRAVLALARSFDMGAVAEGIEDERDAAVLTGLGCDMGQGYLFSRPLPAEQALAFCERS